MNAANHFKNVVVGFVFNRCLLLLLLLLLRVHACSLRFADEQFFREEGKQCDYSRCSRFRTFELIVEGKSIFVNASVLAEISDYFAILCFNECFKEQKEQKATIEDETHDDIFEMISCIHIDSRRKLKPITAEKFAFLLRLADKYQIPSLTELCETFIMNEQFDYILIADPVLYKMQRAAVDFGLSSDAQSKLLDRVAEISSNNIPSRDRLHRNARTAERRRVFAKRENCRVLRNRREKQAVRRKY